MTPPTSIHAQIESILVAEIPNSSATASLDPNTSLLDQGIIDSIRLVRIVGTLEERFNVSITDEDMIPENFETPACIVQLIERTVAAQKNPG